MTILGTCEGYGTYDYDENETLIDHSGDHEERWCIGFVRQKIIGDEG